MTQDELSVFRHPHDYGGAGHGAGERRTRWVVGVTLVMMAAEIAAGLVFGSMALLADGWHMGTHAAALGVALFAYRYARRHAADPRYTFGTGKVGALGGFASAVGLAVVALLVLAESLSRLARPVAIRFDEAILVAVIGLAVNLGSALLLRDHDHGHAHDDDHDHGDEHEHERGHEHGRERERGPGAARVHRDHNLRAAYLHVLADALTSVLAIVALVTGKTLGWTFMDPVMGIVGSLVIARWSVGLLRDTSGVLLDAEFAGTRDRAIRGALERGTSDRVADLHVWRIGPRHAAAIVSVVTGDPRPPDHYRERLRAFEDLVHVTVEVNAHPSSGRAAG